MQEALKEKQGKWQSTVEHHHDYMKHIQREAVAKMKQEMVDRRIDLEKKHNQQKTLSQGIYIESQKELETFKAKEANRKLSQDESRDLELKSKLKIERRVMNAS